MDELKFDFHLRNINIQIDLNKKLYKSLYIPLNKYELLIKSHIYEGQIKFSSNQTRIFNKEVILYVDNQLFYKDLYFPYFFINDISKTIYDFPLGSKFCVLMDKKLFLIYIKNSNLIDNSINYNNKNESEFKTSMDIIEINSYLNNFNERKETKLNINEYYEIINKIYSILFGYPKLSILINNIHEFKTKLYSNIIKIVNSYENIKIGIVLEIENKINEIKKFLYREHLNIEIDNINKEYGKFYENLNSANKISLWIVRINKFLKNNKGYGEEYIRNFKEDIVKDKEYINRYILLFLKKLFEIYKLRKCDFMEYRIQAVRILNKFIYENLLFFLSISDKKLFSYMENLNIELEEQNSLYKILLNIPEQEKRSCNYNNHYNIPKKMIELLKNKILNY